MIITKNEETNIGRCIDSVISLANEILVADSFSTDKTADIVREKGGRILEIEWLGYSETKNKANQNAVNDWILSLDADEYLSDELANEISSLSLDNEIEYYEFRRRNFYGDKLIRFGSFNPDLKVRLWNKNHGIWKGEVHEELEMDKGCIKKRLHGGLMHYSYASITDHRQRARKYALISANGMYEKGKRVNSLKPILSAFYKFIFDYFIKLGILDGWNGLRIALISSKASYLKYHFLRQQTRESES